MGNTSSNNVTSAYGGSGAANLPKPPIPIAQQIVSGVNMAVTIINMGMKAYPAIAGAIATAQAVSSGYAVAGTQMAKQVGEQLTQKIAQGALMKAVGKALGAVAVALSSYNMFQIFENMFENGFSWAEMAMLGMAYFGALMGLIQMGVHAGAAALIAGGIMVGAMAAAFIKTLFSSGPPPENVAADTATQQIQSVVWAAGPVIAIGLGTAALVMNWMPGHREPMSTITMPAYQLSAMIQAKGGPALPPQGITTPTVLVERGQGSNPTEVMIVSPGGNDQAGHPMQKITTYTLPNSLGITMNSYGPSSGYIPFFKYVNGVPQPNQDALDALTKQDSVLKAALSGYTNAMDALKMITIAAAANKYGATPIGLN